MSHKTTVMAIVNQKGGTGKTTTCENLGVGLAKEGKKVLLVDFDPQGSLTISLGYPNPDEMSVTLSNMLAKVIQGESINDCEGILHHREGVDLVPGNIELSGMEISLVTANQRETVLKRYLDVVKQNYDYVLTDCMSSLGMLTLNALAASDNVLIPVQAQYLSAKGLEQLLKTVNNTRRKVNPKLKIEGILLTMVDKRTVWRPSDLAQRLGRIVRQGNRNQEVEIFRYVTEGTFDAYLYQLVENKQKFIAQIMTSKAPVRVADDVDETALSYSEIKALATGNPLIIEKCNLDMEVGKLNMLKANYLSQKYGLEEMVLRRYPIDIQRLTEREADYKKDIKIVEEYPKPEEGFAGMKLFDVLYNEKEAAGKEIINACTKMTGSDTVYLGQYRGFSLTLSYDGTSNEYRMTMKGTLSHTVVLGADVFGNITRMDNVLEKFPEKLGNVQAELAETKRQLENARMELEQPFQREAELQEKAERLKELNILLNMDQKDKTLMDDVLDEKESERSRSKGYER